MSDVNIFFKVKLSPNCIYVAFDAQQLIKIQAHKNCFGNFEMCEWNNAITLVSEYI